MKRDAVVEHRTLPAGRAFRRYCGRAEVTVVRTREQTKRRGAAYTVIVRKPDYETRVNIAVNVLENGGGHPVIQDVAEEAVRLVATTEWVKLTEDWSPRDFAWKDRKMLWPRITAAPHAGAR